MAPVSLPRRKPKENQYPFDLGLKGRYGVHCANSELVTNSGLEKQVLLFLILAFEMRMDWNRWTISSQAPRSLKVKCKKE